MERGHGFFFFVFVHKEGNFICRQRVGGTFMSEILPKEVKSIIMRYEIIITISIPLLQSFEMSIPSYSDENVFNS